MIIIVEDTRLLSCTFHCVGSRLLTIIYKKNTGLNFSHSGVFLPFKLEFSMSFKSGNSSNHCRKLLFFFILGVNVYNICMQQKKLFLEIISKKKVLVAFFKQFILKCMWHTFLKKFRRFLWECIRITSQGPISVKVNKMSRQEKNYSLGHKSHKKLPI